MSRRSRHSRRSVPTKRSALALASGALIGVGMISTPSDRKTSAKALKGAETSFGHAAASYSWISPPNTSRRRMPIGPRGGTVWRLAGLWRVEVESSVRSCAVVVVDIGAEDARKVPSTEDECPVQALGADRSHPALGEGVGLRSPERSEDRASALGPKHLVEGAAVLRVPVMDEEPHLVVVVPEEQIPRLLGDPGGVGVGGDASEVDASRRQLDEKQHVERLQGDRLHGEEVTGQHAFGLRPQKPRPAWD